MHRAHVDTYLYTAIGMHHAYTYMRSTFPLLCAPCRKSLFEIYFLLPTHFSSDSMFSAVRITDVHVYNQGMIARIYIY